MAPLIAKDLPRQLKPQIVSKSQKKRNTALSKYGFKPIYNQRQNQRSVLLKNQDLITVSDNENGFTSAV